MPKENPLLSDEELKTILDDEEDSLPEKQHDLNKNHHGFGNIKEDESVSSDELKSRSDDLKKPTSTTNSTSRADNFGNRQKKFGTSAVVKNNSPYKSKFKKEDISNVNPKSLSMKKDDEDSDEHNDFDKDDNDNTERTWSDTAKDLATIGAGAATGAATTALSGNPFPMAVGATIGAIGTAYSLWQDYQKNKTQMHEAVFNHVVTDNIISLKDSMDNILKAKVAEEIIHLASYQPSVIGKLNENYFINEKQILNESCSYDSEKSIKNKIKERALKAIQQLKESKGFFDHLLKPENAWETVSRMKGVHSIAHDGKVKGTITTNGPDSFSAHYLEHGHGSHEDDDTVFVKKHLGDYKHPDEAMDAIIDHHQKLNGDQD